MKRPLLLVPALCAILVSCKPNAGTTAPQESVDTTTAVDTVPVAEPSLKLSFSTPGAADRFKRLFEEPLTLGLTLDSTEAVQGTTYTIALYKQEHGLIPIDSSVDFAEIDLTDTTTKWDTEATANLLSTLPISPLQAYGMVSHTDTLYTVEQQNESMYHIVGTEDTFNAIGYVTEIHRIAERSPLLVSALFGSIEGLNEYVAGTARTISGIAPLSPTSFGIKTTQPFTPAPALVNRILPGSSFGYTYSAPSDLNKAHTFAAGYNQKDMPHLESIAIEEAGSGDPIISLSTGSYDGALLYRNGDRRVVANRLTNMNITPIDTFTVVAVISSNQKQIEPALSSSLNPEYIKKSLPFEATEAETLFPTDIPVTTLRPAVPAMIVDEIEVIADQSNGIESSIAMNTVSALKMSSVNAVSRILPSEEFGKRTYSGDYTIMITSLPKSLLKSEQAPAFIKSLYGESTITPLLHVPLFLAADTTYKLIDENLSSLVKSK